MAEKWSRWSGERLVLGLRRYFGAWWAGFKFLVAYPLLRPKLTNRFAFGLLSLQDELAYRCDQIPCRPLWEIFPGAVSEDVSVGRVFPGEGSSISAFETLTLAAIIRHLKPRRVFEIGTSVGVTAYNLALNLPPDGELFTLDLPPVEATSTSVPTHFRVSVSDRKMIFAARRDRRFLGSSLESRIHQLYGDSATFDYTPYLGTCDLVFVDGSHALEYVEADTRTAFRLAKPGGWVIWHDYNDGFFWPDVRTYLKRESTRRPIQRIQGTMFAIAQASTID